MPQSPPWQARQAGDRCVVLEFGNTIDRKLADSVAALDASIMAAIEADRLPGVLETIPTFRSLALIIDPLQVQPHDVIDSVRKLASSDRLTSSTPLRHWHIPVRYGDECGPDLSQVAEQTSQSEDAVIRLHQDTSFSVYMLGFLPGFAFMGDTPAALHLPRRLEPRLRVPAGSVAIAGQLTGVYPWDSPGGWHILGHCPVPLFDGLLNPPALFRAGDRVSFRSIDDAEHASLKELVSTGQFDRNGLAKPPQQH